MEKQFTSWLRHNLISDRRKILRKLSKWYSNLGYDALQRWNSVFRRILLELFPWFRNFNWHQQTKNNVQMEQRKTRRKSENRVPLRRCLLRGNQENAEARAGALVFQERKQICRGILWRWDHGQGHILREWCEGYGRQLEKWAFNIKGEWKRTI